MTPTEAGMLLTVAAAFDNRKPDKDAATAWGLALGDLPWVDCRDAIVAYYQTNSEWVMPAHVRSAVRAVRTKRILDNEDKLLPPPDAREGAAMHAWLADAKRRLGDGEPIETVNPPQQGLEPRYLPELKLRQLIPAPDTQETP